MSLLTVAAAGSALALYFYSRKAVEDFEDPPETHQNIHTAGSSVTEDFYILSESLRYSWREARKWGAADLLFGINYLCRKDAESHPASDIAEAGHPYAAGLTGPELAVALNELSVIERLFRYCSGMRERRALPQRAYFKNILGVEDDDLLKQEIRAGILKPSYVLVRDKSLRVVLLIVRGTHSFKDMFTSLTGACKPHHLYDTNGVTLGYAHFGMLAAARYLKAQLQQDLQEALAANPGYQLKIVGHSLGGGTAALLTMMLREVGAPFAETTCVAIACPSCMTLELATSCKPYVTTVINGADVIPTVCPATADALRGEISSSSWMTEFREDVRSSAMVQAVERGIRGVGSVTLTATNSLTSSFKTCYHSGRQSLKRRNSDSNLSLEVVEDAISTPDSESRIHSMSKKLGSVAQGAASVAREQSEKLTRSATNIISHFSWAAVQQQHEEAAVQDAGVDYEESLDLNRKFSSRMEEVVRAVHEAEEEEAALHLEDHVPSVNSAESHDCTDSPEAQNGSWKRQMYPAGRILHFVPLRLIGGIDEGNSLVRGDSDASIMSITEGLQEEEEAVAAAAAGDPEILTQNNSTVEPMVLLDNVPQDAYNRIKLCRTVLRDHIIPQYLNSLESAARILQEGRMKGMTHGHITQKLQ